MSPNERSPQREDSADKDNVGTIYGIPASAVESVRADLIRSIQQRLNVSSIDPNYRSVLNEAILQELLARDQDLDGDTNMNAAVRSLIGANHVDGDDSEQQDEASEDLSTNPSAKRKTRTCSQCGKTIKGNLQRHIRSVHNHETQSCPHCG
jgi:hypothetical protein